MGDAKLLLLTILVILGLVQSAPYGSEKSKRPFCNAFTGCGRKRSDPLLNALSGVDSDYGQMESSYQVSLSRKNSSKFCKFGQQVLFQFNEFFSQKIQNSKFEQQQIFDLQDCRAQHARGQNCTQNV